MWIEHLELARLPDGGPACATVRLLGDGWAIDKQEGK